MLVVHLSGPPASGKTSLARIFSQQSDVYVVETEDFISDALAKELQSMIGQKQAEEKWVTTVREHLQIIHGTAIAKKCRMLIIVGLLCYRSKTLVISWVEHKFYLTIPEAELLSRFYSRYANFKEENEFWEKLSKRQLQIPNSADLLKLAEKENRIHKAAGYVQIPPKEVEARIVNLLKLNHG